MPCHVDPDPDHPVKNPNASHLTAYLCGVLTVLEANGDLPKILPQINEMEMGLTRADLVNWWHKHQDDDRRRRVRERQDAAAEKKDRRKQYEQLKKEFGE